ncbi:MAG: N-acetyltransferase [Christensenellaceae bacterium]|nr:N-acetyltransferase [Christensenellaceae bacterium]
MGNRIVIRNERKEDERTVEELVRDSFWNVYRPGALEHYLIHVLRNDPLFVRELDLVMELDGRTAGQVMFMKAKVETDIGEDIPVLTMGPISVANDLKHRGLGRILLDDALLKASSLGYGAVLIEGNITFYGGSGFIYGRERDIRYKGLPEGADSSFFLLRELIPGYLEGKEGVYGPPEGYLIDEKDALEFDKGFPIREKLRLPGQLI